jgi:Transglycosylase SLT domain
VKRPALLARGRNRPDAALRLPAQLRRWVGAVIVLATASTGANGGSLVAGDALQWVAFAVEGTESSHGADPKMWRDDADGPQGPMQVSAAAAADVGGGNRFDPAENRVLGRAYLSHLYRRYANWPDALAAYNWGPGNMDTWIGAGRPIDKFPIAVSLYRMRVLFGSSAAGGLAIPRLGRLHPPPRRSLADLHHPSRDSIAVEELYTEIMADSERAIR